MVFLLLMEKGKTCFLLLVEIWCNDMGYVDASDAMVTQHLPPFHCFPLAARCFLSSHSPHHPMVNSSPSNYPSFLPAATASFQAFFLSSDPSDRGPPSPFERVELVSFLYRLLSCHPRPSGRQRASERAPPRTDQPANGQTVGRSLFRCHRGRPERAKHVSEGVSGLAVSETV